jgi:cytochrome c oxidase assembly factor CtaG/ferredoxin
MIPGPNSSDAILSSWSIPVGLTAGLIFSAFLYFRGWLKLQFQVPHRFPLWRLLAFWGGLLTIFIAVASPLDAFGGLLLQVHMVQHLLLMMLAPPALLSGAPYLPILSGLPRFMARDIVGPFLVWPPLKAFGNKLVNPIVCWIAFVTSNIFWHLPPLYELALSSRGWHELEHFCFLGTGLLFWWPLVQPWPSRARWPRWTMIPYLILADLQNTGLAAFLTFYDRVLYSTYEHAPRLWGFGARDDQVLAGVIMWVPGSIVFLVPAAVIAIGFLSPSLKVRPSEADERGIASRQETELSQWFRKLNLRPRRKSEPFDLFKVPFLGIILKSKLFRRGMQLILFLLAIAIVLDGWFGPQTAPMNLAGVLPWTHWRGFSVLALLICGNFFCMACPFTFVRDIGRRFLPAKRVWPRLFRTKWLAVVLIGIYLWAYEAFSLWNSPWLTAWVITAYFVAALLVDGFFRDASFCKYVCPIGQFHFVQSLVSPFEVKVRQPDVCASCRTYDCIRGNDQQRGCELKLFQPKKKSSFDCTFCMDCVHACPHENVSLIAVTPGKSLWDGEQRSSIGRFSKRTDLAGLILLLVCGAFANAAGMTAPISSLFDLCMLSLGLGRPLVIGIFLLFTLVLLPAVLVSLAGLISRCLMEDPKVTFHPTLSARRESSRKPTLLTLISDFAPALVPLGFSMWIAHLGFHLFTGSHTPIPVLQRLAVDLKFGDFGLPNWAISSWAFPQLLDWEILFLDLGLLLSMYAAWRIAKRYTSNRAIRVALPWLIFQIVLFLAGVWIIFQPMDMRGTSFG